MNANTIEEVALKIAQIAVPAIMTVASERMGLESNCSNQTNRLSNEELYTKGVQDGSLL